MRVLHILSSNGSGTGVRYDHHAYALDRNPEAG